ncbi:sensor domain-containing diguanylate cyclase, partial [Kineosporia rhizophila]|uniref:GGDEF domain-containing protein n=1 Tax=Kineosporia rhizophila TaxID=84633 RepID=UPI001E2CCA64
GGGGGGGGGGDPPRILGRPIELDALAKDGRLIPVELTIWRADGQYGTGVEAGGGEFYAFIRDTTERARAARQAAAIAAAQLAIADVELSPQKVMQEICARAQALTGAEAACVQTVDGDDLVYRVGSGAAREHEGLRLPIALSLSGLAFTTSQALLSTDTHTDPRAHADTVLRTGARSVVAVPLQRGGEVHGVVNVYSRRPHAFGEPDCVTLNLLAAPFGAALANAWHLETTTSQAATDVVTGLWNRAYALRQVDAALLRHGHRAEGYVAAVFIDLDRFKPVNDTHGHDAGDQVLRDVGERLRLAVRRTDLCARYGGDEFLVLCPSLPEVNDVRALAERLIELVAGVYHLDNGADVTIGASLGIAVAGVHTTSATLLQAADEAMYEAKRTGGNAHVIRVLDAAGPV